MSSNIDALTKDLADTIRNLQNKKVAPYDTQATVTRVEGNTAWVHIPGGVDETPVQLTANAKPGDIVQIRVSGGQAWLYGNTTSPPTDDTKAIVAEKKAVLADEHAIDAMDSAGIAKEAADSAQESAEIARAVTDEIEEYAQTVSKTVSQVLEDGETAGVAAQQASAAASTAIRGLSTVENVVDTLNWISEHGTMESQAGEIFDSGKVYFVVDPNGDYTVQGTNYSVVTEPQEDQIDNYYCLKIDESIQNYIATHVAVDDEGLWLVPVPNDSQNGSYKMLIAVGGNEHEYKKAGTYILDDNDEPIAQFLENGISFDSSKNFIIGDDDSWIEFDSSTNSILVSGSNTTIASPVSILNWDMSLSASNRYSFNTKLGLSEDISTWVYDDFTTSEMENINAELGMSSPVDSWETHVAISEYKSMCKNMGLPYNFGRSLYIAMDGISLGNDFYVDSDGYCNITSGKIGAFDIDDDGLVYGTTNNSYYANISTDYIKYGNPSHIEHTIIDNNGFYHGRADKRGSRFYPIQIEDVFSVDLWGECSMKRCEVDDFISIGKVEIWEDGSIYLDSSIGSADYSTRVCAADKDNKYKTPAFSTVSGGYYSFYVQSNGALKCYPSKSNGTTGDAAFEIREDGIYIWPGETKTYQPNLCTSGNRIYFSSWTSSSEQIKKKVENIKSESILPNKLYDVDIVQFQYKDDFLDTNDARFGKTLVGFLIEDLDKKYPIAVDKVDENDPKTWSWNSAYIIPPMLKLIQDQKKEIDELRSEIEEIKKIIKGEAKI